MDQSCIANWLRSRKIENRGIIVQKKSNEFHEMRAYFVEHSDAYVISNASSSNYKASRWII